MSNPLYVSFKCESFGVIGTQVELKNSIITNQSNSIHTMAVVSDVDRKTKVIFLLIKFVNLFDKSSNVIPLRKTTKFSYLKSSVVQTILIFVIIFCFKIEKFNVLPIL